MKTLDALKKVFTQNLALEAEKNNKLAMLKRDLDQKRSEAEAAAVAGETDKYMQISEEIRKLEATIYVTEKCKTGTQFTSEELQLAWRSYTKDYKEKLDKAMDAYTKKRKELVDEYLKLVDLQEEAIRTRDNCGVLAGMELGSDDDLKRVMNRFPMTYIPEGYDPWQPHLQYGNLNLKHPDAVFFTACHLIDDEELTRLNSVLRLHKAVYETA